MTTSSHLRLALGLLVAGTCQSVLLPEVWGNGPVRSQAVVDLTFDAPTGDALDSAAAGKQPDKVSLVNGARRVTSPFWNQPGKGALLLDAEKKQFVQIADSPDVDRPDALTFSLFYLNLHELNDAAFHGIVAKRSAANPAVTNYGINFRPQSDAFQLYVNDGSGFRVVVYSVKEVIGYRRRVFLTATFEVGDAPAPDNDTDKDDVLVRLFVNGSQVKPANVNQGAVSGNDAWLTDVKVAGLLNDAPLTLGASTPASEFASGLIDEFLLFDKALPPDQVRALFLEVAGNNADELAQKELQPPPARPDPTITGVSLRGLKAGETTRLTITGRNLGPGPRVVMPVSGLQQKGADGSDAGRVIVDVTVPADTPPGFYPLSIQTANGLSDALVMAVDRLRQASLSESSPQKPAALPAAFSGTLSGSAQARVYFTGTSRQRIAAEVEAKRLGSKFDPVLEVKTARGTPLLIEWGQTDLRGDARAAMTLPADGLYYVELHDLEYKAPGQNPYRLKIGDLKLVDAWFPPAVPAGTAVSLQPIGIGFPPDTSFPVDLSAEPLRLADLLPLPQELGPLGPAPAVRLSDNVEIVEASPSGGPPSPAGQLQTVPARFAENSRVPVVINGRLLQPGEVDTYVLEVTPGQNLNLSVAGRAIDSPLDGRLSILSHPDGKLLASNDDRPGTRDPGLDYTVPGNVERLQVSVGDLYDRGGAHFLYRLRIAPSGRPDFRLTVMNSKLSLPRQGTTVAQLKLTRSGYNGPIKLSVPGAEGVSILPEEIPAGGGNGNSFVTLTDTSENRKDDLLALRIVGESVGLTPPLRRVAEIAAGPVGVASAAYRDLLPMAMVSATGPAVTLKQTPPALFKGVPTEVSLEVARKSPDDGLAVRFSLMSNEPPRPVDPRAPKKGNKPLVRALPDQNLPAGTTTGTLQLAVPLDVAAGAIDFVVRAELVAHPYAQSTLADGYSKPFRLPVKNALSLKLDERTLSLTAGTENAVRGTVQRTAGFQQPVDVVLTGLPDGYSAAKVTVPADQQDFSIALTAEKEPKPRDLPNVKVRVSLPGGGPILPDQNVAIKVAPPTKPQPAVAPKP